MDRYKLRMDVGMLMINIYQTTQITEALQGIEALGGEEDDNAVTPPTKTGGVRAGRRVKGQSELT